MNTLKNVSDTFVFIYMYQLVKQTKKSNYVEYSEVLILCSSMSM